MFRNGQRFWGKLLHQLDALEILKIDIDKKMLLDQGHGWWVERKGPPNIIPVENATLCNRILILKSGNDLIMIQEGNSWIGFWNYQSTKTVANELPVNASAFVS